MTALLPFAESMLAQHGEFYPFGGTISASGEITHSAAWTGDSHPESQDLIDKLKAGFQADAAKGKIIATALVYDTLVIPPGKNSKQDAISVALDHRDNYSIVVVFPYTRSSSGEALLEEPFASQGSGEVFGH